MAKYTRETVAEVLAALDIEQIVRPVVELKPAGGGRLKGLCPFHQEKTPSFHLNRDRQAYHCFGCGKGGDALSFVMEYDGLTFVEALRKLADIAGVRLPAMSEHEDRAEWTRKQLQDLGQFALQFFRQQLQDPMRGSVPRQYLKKRTLREATVQRFGLGYAPDGYNNFLEAARVKGFKDVLLENSGLLKRGDRGGLYDFFRHRLMIPIREVSGQVVAFGGRDLGDSPAKYINSPETTLYKKSRVLYGLHEAREAMRKSRQALLVEGYFDALRLFDAGIENVVASCGTALTLEQAQLIARYAHEVVIVYDGDSAGIKAAMKATGVLAATGLRVRALCLPEAQDPDDYIVAHGAASFQDLVANAPDFVTYYARMSRERLSTIEGKSAVARELFEIIAGLDDQLRVDAYLKRTAEELGLNEQSARQEFFRLQRPAERTFPALERPQVSSAALNVDDVNFLAILLQEPAHAARARERLHDAPLPDSALGRVLAAIIFGEEDGVGTHVFEDDSARRLFAAAAAAPEIENGDEYKHDLVEKRLRSLEREALRAAAEHLQRQIQEAAAADPARVVQLIAEKARLVREMEALGAA